MAVQDNKLVPPITIGDLKLAPPITIGALNIAADGSVSVSTSPQILSGGSYSALSLPYGLQWDETNDTYQRLGFVLPTIAPGTKPADFLLPIQNQMRRCVLNDAGVVQYYLHPNDSTKKIDGTAANLDGTDGQVMVEIPKFWYRYTYVAPFHNWEISPVAVDGFSVHPAFIKDGVEVAYRYIGAYEGVLYDTSASRYADGIYQSAWSCTFASADKSITANSRTAPFINLGAGDKITVSGTTSNNDTFTVASIVSGVKITVSEALTNETAASTVLATQKDFTATTGDKLSSVSGKTPITMATRAQFRVAAKNRGTGWRQLDFDLYSAIQLLYLVEYGSFSSQSILGAGITNVSGWDVYNGYNPVARTGNSLTNASANTAGSSSAETEKTKYLSYRGIENWYGHLWKFVDGININSNVPYVSNNSTQWADDTASNYTDLSITLHNADGYQASLKQVSRGFFPASVGASTITKITDYYYQASGWRVVVAGGAALSGGYAGAFCLDSSGGSGGAGRYFGGRLCF